MPIYEYRCADCRRRVSVFFRSFSAVSDPVCPRCGGQHLTRLMSKVAVRRGGGSAGADFDDDAGMGGMLDGLDENDPRALARAMRRMSDEMGEPIEPEMAEALGRLEAGEDPDTVMAGLDEQGGAGGEDDEF
ncbi:MAG TPA: zinc ribbon domain-containing protein [Thermomicrobiales bacterium]|nr:zinc ribbon domain-containing protein [Thermomicrobiales bacterium]